MARWTDSQMKAPITRRVQSARGPATRQSSVRYCDAAGRPLTTARARRVSPEAARTLDRGVALPVGPPAQPALRITRRGRIAVVLLTAALLLAVFSLGRASSHAAPGGARVERPTVVVQHGETLWALAKRAAPRTDPRITVERILMLNDMESVDEVRPGQQLVLPG